ncbi:MAG: hypothetical protein AAB367_02400 [Patescibacteria group bacterium]
MNGNIDKLIQFVADNNVFNEEKYPELKGADDKKRLLFAINHSALHFAKVSGVIAGISEAVDHGKELDTETLKTSVVKSFINVLRLAELVGMSEKDLVEAVEKRYKS